MYIVGEADSPIAPVTIVRHRRAALAAWEMQLPRNVCAYRHQNPAKHSLINQLERHLAL